MAKMVKICKNCKIKYGLFESVFFINTTSKELHLQKILRPNNKLKVFKSGAESRNSERTFNCALRFADKMFFQGPYTFYLRRGICSSTFHNKISDLVK